MKSIVEAKNLEGKRVLVRVDWSDGDSFRIKSAKRTLEFLESAGAKIILATHMDVNAVDLQEFVPKGAKLLSNLRENPGEESNSEEFARELASQADIYVNEAFPVSHRAHASIVGVPKLLPSYAGIEFVEEVEKLSYAFNPPHPFLLILGGVKFETKMPLVEKFLHIADKIFIAGAMAPKVGEEIAQHPKVVLPVGDIGALDADDRVIEQVSEMISKAKFILWNGPLGKYEEGYKVGTLSLATLLAESGKQVIVGGGDTLASIKELKLLDKFFFLSTGGGAMLDFLAKGTLPGIEALAPHP